MTQPRCIVLKGLPGSGKTTFAKQYQAKHPGTLRTNKDELRALLHDSVYSKSNERFVLAVRDYIVDKALSEGHSIIIDDTNFGDKHLTRIATNSVPNIRYDISHLVLITAFNTNANSTNTNGASTHMMRGNHEKIGISFPIGEFLRSSTFSSYCACITFKCSTGILIAGTISVGA